MTLVGEDFGPVLPPPRLRRPLAGLAGRRMATLAGMSPQRLYARTRRINVVLTSDHWHDPARVRMGVAVALAFARSGPLVLLGTRVAAAFGMGSVQPYTWRSIRGHRVAWVPHPSGRNRVLNDPDERRRMGAFLRSAIG